MCSDMYIVLHPDTAHRIGINFLEKIFLQFGMQHLEVLIRLDSSLNPTTIILSENTVHTLSIPTSLEYEVILHNNTLLIGPYIGILYSFSGGRLVEFSEKSLYFIDQYKYKDIKGAIILFAFENIDNNNKKINGYLYEPNEQKWIPGVYPYPASIFRLAVLAPRSLLFLQNEFGKNFFNAHRFNKWEMYNWLTQDLSVSSHLPPTTLYTKPEDIFNFLEKHPYLYVKPIKGFKGRGIIKIIKNDNLISVQYKEDNNIKVDFNEINKAYIYLDNLLKNGKYIIQKMLDITFENQVVDFRLILMKDQCGDWRDLGLYGRIGSPQNIVSNRSSGGKVEKDIFVLKKIYKLSQEEALLYRMQMSDIALKAAKAMDKLGFSMGRYGIDMALDQNKNIWLIEMNHRDPNDRIASYAGDKNLIHDIRFQNMLYAKNLAGFPKHTQHINVKILCGDCSG